MTNWNNISADSKSRYKVIHLIVSYTVLALCILSAWVPECTAVENVKITVDDEGIFCKFNYLNDDKYKFCAYYGGLPFDALRSGHTWQGLVTVVNEDPLYIKEK